MLKHIAPGQPPRTTLDSGSGGKRQAKKRGRPRKPGPRDGSGRLKKPSRAQRAKAERSAAVVLAEKLPVLKQPHRLGNDDRLVESPLGRILIRHNASRELFTIGVNFGELVRAWSRAIGSPTPIIPAAHLTVRQKKGQPRQADCYVMKDHNREIQARDPVPENWDYQPWVDEAADRARKADDLAKQGHRKLQRLRRPLDKACRIILGAAANLRPALRYPAMVLDRVRTVCANERDLNSPEDEPYVIAALTALHDSGMALSRDGPSPDHADAMTQYEIRLGIYRAAYGVE